MGDTPRLNFPYIVSSHILDALVQPVIEGALVNTPPSSPTAGVLYVVGRSPNGAWTGKAECLAQFVNDVWTFYVPFEGLTAWNKASKSRWYYSGSEWSELSDDQHGKRTDNPHQVTAAQLGAETPSGAQTKANAVQTNLTAHINSGTHKWSSITDKPGTLKDYGIGDTYTKTEADSYREEAKTQIGAEQSELGVEIKGRTLVNLLGKDGNFEVDTDGNGMADGWGLGSTAHWSTTALDTDAYIGTKSQKLVGSGNGSYTSIAKNYAISASKYYVLLANVKSPNATVCYTRFGSDSGGLTFAAHQISSSWSTICRKLNPTIDATMVQFYTAQATPNTNTFYIDGVRLYEITQAEYNAIDSMTADQVATKYPYVDSVQFKKDVLVTQIGKNLLPAFNSGEWTLHANAVVNSAYNVTHNAAAAGENSTITFSNLVQLKEYTFSMTYTGTVDITCLTNGVATRNIVIGNSSSIIKFTLSGSENAVRILLKSPSAGTYTFTNPQLELSSTATPFEPQVKSYAHTPMQIADGESVWLTPNTSVYREVWKKGIAITGPLLFGHNNDGAGYKGFSLQKKNYFHNSLASTTDLNIICIKSNGIPLKASMYSPDTENVAPTATTFIISVADTDTGFPETYTVSQAEIQAYFYGWKMCASDGSTYVSGTKYWKKITDGTGITSTLPTASYAGYTPYVLYYKLATPVYHINYLNHDPTKPILSAGSVVNIPQGVTQVEQRSGVIFKEKANPALYSGNYHINSTGLPTTQLSYRAKKIFRVDGGKLWSISNTSNTYGLERAFIDTASYDSNVTYTATYEQLDKYLYTVETFAIDNPAPARQRNFALDSTEQKIAYFKINPVSLVGATANQNPKTLNDYGILDAYTKDTIDTKFKESTLITDFRILKDVAQYVNNSSSSITGILKLTLPIMNSNIFCDLEIGGYNQSSVSSSWSARIGFQTTNAGSTFGFTHATLSANCPFSIVQFGTDGTNLCILFGTESTIWGYPAINVSKVQVTQPGALLVKNSFSLSLLAANAGFTSTSVPVIRGSLNNPNPLVGGNIYKYRDLAGYRSDSIVTGTIQILLPIDWANTMMNIEVEGYNHNPNPGSWNVVLSGYAYLNTTQWYYPTSTLSPNCPFTSVRFAYDSIAKKPCILLGITSTSWSAPKIIVKEMLAGGALGSLWQYATGWAVNLLTDESAITGIVSPNIKTLATIDSGALTVNNASTGNIRSAYFNNTDYAAGNRNYIQVRQQVTSNSSYSAMLGVDKDTGNVWLSNDAVTVQHLAITPSGKVGIGSFAKQASKQLEVTTAHTTNIDDDIRFGSYAHSTTGFYGLGMNYRISSTGNPSAHIINYRGDTKYTNVTLSGDNVGIGITDPKATFHSTGSTIVGVDRSTLNYTNIGNSQMQMSLSESDNVLWLDAKRSDGTTKQIGLPLGSSTIITGTNLWISSEYQPVVNTVTSVAHGLTLDPVRCRCDVLLKCVVAQGNYSVGDFAMGVIVNVGGSAEFVLSPALDSTNIRVNSGSGGPYAMNKNTGAYFQVTPANWRYVFRIWY